MDQPKARRLSTEIPGPPRGLTLRLKENQGFRVSIDGKKCDVIVTHVDRAACKLTFIDKDFKVDQIFVQPD